jgi:hypothetical protein
LVKGAEYILLYLRRVFSKKEASRFFSRVSLHFTPTHASWLNMAQIEINCLKAQGLKQRIASEKEMNQKKDAIVAERNGRLARIDWGFTKAKAREKFPALYGTN